LKEDILSLILQTEKEYHHTVRKAVEEAEKYADDCKKNQGAALEDLEQEWYSYEREEKEKWERAFQEEERKMEAEMKKSKEKLEICQREKAEAISERLMEEVFSLYGGS